MSSQRAKSAVKKQAPSVVAAQDDQMKIRAAVRAGTPKPRYSSLSTSEINEILDKFKTSLQSNIEGIVATLREELESVRPTTSNRGFMNELFAGDWHEGALEMMETDLNRLRKPTTPEK